jgi:hypothetical protein
MTAQRAVHRLMFLAIQQIGSLGLIYRIDRVSRSGRLLSSEYVDINHEVVWC